MPSPLETYQPQRRPGILSAGMSMMPRLPTVAPAPMVPPAGAPVQPPALEAQGNMDWFRKMMADHGAAATASYQQPVGGRVAAGALGSPEMISKMAAAEAMSKVPASTPPLMSPMDMARMANTGGGMSGGGNGTWVPGSVQSPMFQEFMRFSGDLDREHDAQYRLAVGRQAEQDTLAKMMMDREYGLKTRALDLQEQELQWKRDPNRMRDAAWMQIMASGDPSLIANANDILKYAPQSGGVPGQGPDMAAMAESMKKKQAIASLEKQAFGMDAQGNINYSVPFDQTMESVLPSLQSEVEPEAMSRILEHMVKHPGSGGQGPLIDRLQVDLMRAMEKTGMDQAGPFGRKRDFWSTDVGPVLTGPYGNRSYRPFQVTGIPFQEAWTDDVATRARAESIARLLDSIMKRRPGAKWIN